MRVPGLQNLSSAFTGLWARLRNGGNSFDEVLTESVDRANVRFFLPEDSRLYVTEWNRVRLNEKAEWLWQSFALVKELVEGIARHVIGKGISIQFETTDRDWNKAAASDFEKWALTPSRCDISGRRNFYEAQSHAVEQYILRGEFLSGFVENPRWPGIEKGGVKNQGAPSFWLIDSNDCLTPPIVQDPDLMYRLIDGVELGPHGEPVNYMVRTAGTYDFNPIPADSICHWYKPHATNQPRGVTPFAQAINPLVDVYELQRLTTRTAKANQLVAMVMKNIAKTEGRGAFGAIRRQSGPRCAPGQTPPTLPHEPHHEAHTELERMTRKAGAGIAYVDKDGDVKMVQSQSPSPLVAPFIRDLLLRNACLAPGVPMEFFWDASQLGGANNRFVIGRADLFFQVLGDNLCYRFFTPMAVRFLAWRMENCLLPQCKDADWQDKITWQLPARITVDAGKDGALDVVKLRSLQLTLRSYYNQRGQNWETEVAQRISELKKIKDLCEAAGMPEMFAYFTALDPGAALVQQEVSSEHADDDTPNNNEDKGADESDKDDKKDDKK